MTINKVQGQILVEVGLYLPQPVFNHGQLYVAISRPSKIFKKLKIQKNDTMIVVYKDIVEL